jgi:hypothetical protein
VKEKYQYKRDKHRNSSRFMLLEGKKPCTYISTDLDPPYTQRAAISGKAIAVEKSHTVTL